MITTILSLTLLGAAGPPVQATEQRDTLLYIATSPAGAEVLVDGKRVGTTPGLFPFKPGVRRVIVELKGHDRRGQDVTIRTGDIKRLKLKLKKQPAAARAKLGKNGVGPTPLAGDATAASILDRLENPPDGWKVIEWSIVPEDEVARIGESLGGRIKRISYTKLSADEKRLEADGKWCEVKVMECRTAYDAENIRRPIHYLMGLGGRPSGLCLRFGDTVVEFVGGDRLGTVAKAAAEELGFAMEAGDPAPDELREDDYVLLVVGKDRLTFEGKLTSWDELRGLLGKVPDRQQKVFAFARTTDDMTINEWNYKYSQVVTRARDFKFKGISFVGERPLGAQGMPYVRLVIAAKDNMTLEGRKITEGELMSALIKVPDRHRTTLEINRASSVGDEMTIQQWNNLSGLPSTMAHWFGFKGVTLTGEKPLGSKAVPESTESGSVDLEYREADPSLAPNLPNASRDRRLSPLNEALELFEQNYVAGVDRPDLNAAAIRGMLKNFDRHSDYIDHADLVALHERLTEKLGGIGAELMYDDKARELRVTSPLPNMPAYRAGVRAGDTIVQIDGKPTDDFPKGKELQTAVTLIRGKPGSTVTIGLKHAGSDALHQIAISRAMIRLPVVRGDTLNPEGGWNFMLDDRRKIGYVRLTDFGPQSARELGLVVDGLMSKGMKAFILDLRNNPGGSLSQAIEVADLFVESGIIVSVKGRQEPGQTWSAKKEGTLVGLPMAVLVNRDSAGAAEIVAACLQDHRRAIVAGERTYGKGTAHRIVELKGGSGAMKLPVATFLRPNGKGFDRSVDAKESDTWGIEPDEKCAVSLSQEEYKRFLEYRRTRDVFSPEDPPKSDFQDRQLQKAIECL